MEFLKNKKRKYWSCPLFTGADRSYFFSDLDFGLCLFTDDTEILSFIEKGIRMEF
jgi:hypothetical protein